MTPHSVYKHPRKFLFVCTGNICRSPTAEGVMRDALVKAGLFDQYTLDSAGISGHHVGEAPDRRTQAEAKHHGVDISDLRARQVKLSDFQHYDVILAMDNSHLRALTNIAPVGTTAEITLYLPYCGIRGITEMPDPYYGEARDFRLVYDLVHEATENLMHQLVPA